MIYNSVALDQNGSIYWNSTKVSDAEFSKLLQQAHAMDPIPVAFLETEMGVRCDRLKAVRDEFDRSMQCKTNGRCAEGSAEVWRKMPLPPGVAIP